VSTSSDITKAQKSLKTNPDKLMRAFALEAANRIIKRTPVDTGRARGNWNLSIDSIDASTTEDTDKKGSQTIMRARANVASAGIEDTVFIANGLPYIKTLENGRHDNKGSWQAPAGMVRLVAAELRPLADQIAARIERG